ncbi:hypothetical protein AB0M48_30245 [Lentzea sp. NPDC051208]|uniref:hypothetical protein n=1 Tax=Lentzea sp. NPDC051208 TaxID=3154642 RepID=UPI003425EA4D
MWHDDLASRIHSAAWDRVATLFGTRLPRTDVTARLAALTALARSHWDFRLGGERSDLGNDLWFDSRSAAIVVDAAAELDMVHSTRAAADRYDGVIVPGGAGHAPLRRLTYALEQRIECAWIAMLGSDRMVTDEERVRSDLYAPAARTEFDLMSAAVEVSSGRSSSEDVMLAAGYEHAPGTTARLRRYHGDPGPVSSAPVWCLSAPAPAGRTRAATEHTFELLSAVASQVLHPFSRLLVVTNALYAPYQHMHALRVLTASTGARVDVAGFSAGHFGHEVRLSPVLLLQEMKSYVDSMWRFTLGAGSVELAA